jgi:hypothetical protein
MTWGIATPLQHTNIRRWLAELTHYLTHRTRAPRPKRIRPHTQREAFIEDAAMAREMLRL